MLYYILKQEVAQIGLLIYASFLFYSWNYPLLLLLLLSSIAINVLTTHFIEQTTIPQKRRLVSIIGVVANLLILSFFKYSPLIGKSFFGNTALGEFLIAIPLPIGISFFTFQGISLVVDTFKDQLPTSPNNINRQKNKLSYIQNRTLFIAFFPQLIAGPIVKAHEFLPQIGLKTFKDIDWEVCFKNLVTGYFLKTVIADNLVAYTGWMDYPHYETASVAHLLFMLFGYSIQIFADFAGYSLIAIGIAGLFGYSLKDNFNFPYISTSFSEFWQRWHISLSSFLKEYLYIPLGGNRKGKVRTYINLMATMVLGGFWHGAAWSYAVWGCYHGLLLAAERWMNNKWKSSFQHPVWSVAKGGFIFILVTLGWLLFKLPDFQQVLGYLSSISTNAFLPNGEEIVKIFNISLLAIPIIAYHIFYVKKDTISLKKVAPIFYGIMLFLIATNQGNSGVFIYFQF